MSDNTNEKIIKVFSTYTEAQKKATKKYRENNKEKVNEQRKKYYENRKAKDPNFLLYKKQKAKEYYAKKKERLLKLKEIEENKDLTNNVINIEQNMEDIKIEILETDTKIEQIEPIFPMDILEHIEQLEPIVQTVPVDILETDNKIDDIIEPLKKKRKYNKKIN